MNTPLPFKVSDIEANYFNALWEVADTQEKGNIAGNVAVQFFMNSGLQGPVLREIWNIADAKKQNYLGRDEFIVALRCIAMVQQGLPVSMNDLAKHGQTVLPLPKFAGLMQPKAQGWTMTLEDRTKYEGLFPRFDEDGDGFIQGKEAVELLSKSGLDRLVLKKIWELADTDADSKLNLGEFCLAMHFSVCCSKRGMTLPNQLPITLGAAVGCRIPPLNASSGGTSAKDTAFGDLASMMPKITPKPKPKPAPTPAASALTPPAPTPAVVSVPPAPSPAPAPAPAPVVSSSPPPPANKGFDNFDNMPPAPAPASVVSSSPPPPANKGFDNFDNVPPAPAPVAAKAEEPKDSFGDMGGMGSLKDMSTMEEIQKPQLSNMSLTPPRDMPKPSNSGHGVVLDPQVASTAKEVKVLAQDTASNARDLVSARSSSSSMNNGSNNQSSVDSGVALKALQEAMNELKGTKTALENEVKAAREEISANEQKQALLNQTASTPSPQVQEAAKQLEELKAEVSKLWQDLSSTRQEVSQSRIALQTTEVKANVSSAVDEAQIVQFANEMASLRQTRTSLLNEIQVAREEIDKL
jgi:Ca2+-binding EF-hand superfamily protein/predicted  nucleic acid-binding Zn-ribbon protein